MTGCLLQEVVEADVGHAVLPVDLDDPDQTAMTIVISEAEQVTQRAFTLLRQGA